MWAPAIITSSTSGDGSGMHACQSMTPSPGLTIAVTGTGGACLIRPIASCASLSHRTETSLATGASGVATGRLMGLASVTTRSTQSGQRLAASRASVPPRLTPDEGHFVCVALRALPHPAFEPFEDVIRRTQVEAAVPRSHREALPREKPAQMRRRNIGRAKSGHDDDRFAVATRGVLWKLQRRSARPYETSDFAQPRAHRNGRTALRPGDKSIGWKNGHGPRQPWKEAIGKCHDLSANGIALRIYGKRFSPNVGKKRGYGRCLDSRNLSAFGPK